MLIFQYLMKKETLGWQKSMDQQEDKGYNWNYSVELQSFRGNKILIRVRGFLAVRKLLQVFRLGQHDPRRSAARFIFFFESFFFFQGMYLPNKALNQTLNYSGFHENCMQFVNSICKHNTVQIAIGTIKQTRIQSTEFTQHQNTSYELGRNALNSNNSQHIGQVFYLLLLNTVVN